MVVSAAGDGVRMRLGEGRGGMEEERRDPEERRGSWGVVVQSSKVQISGTPTLLLFDLHSQ